MRSYAVLVLFLLTTIYSGSYAQTRSIDSLTLILNAYPKNDDQKAELLNTLGYKYLYLNPQKALTYFDQVLKFADKTSNSDRHIMIANLWKGIAYQNLADLKTSNSYTNIGLAIAKRKNLPEYVGTGIATLGLSAMNQGNFVVALQNFQEASNYYRTAKDQRELFMYNNMAVIYSQMKNFDKAYEYFQKVLQVSIERRDSSRIATSLLNIGTVLLDQQMYDPSLPYLNQAERYFLMKEDKVFLAKVYGNKGVAYRNLGQNDSSVYYTRRSIDLNKSIDNKRSAAVQMSNLGSFYSDQNLLAKAKPLLDEAYEIAISQKLVDLHRDVSQNLSSYFEKMGKTDSALFYYRQYVALNDSISGYESQKKMNKLELQYDFDRKADSLRFRNELTAVELQKQVLLSQQQKQQLILVEKENQLQQLLDVKRLIELETEKTEGKEKTRKLTLINKEAELQKERIESLNKDNALNKFRLRQQWFLSLGSIILLGGIGSFFIYRYNVKQASLQADIAKEKAEFESKMSNAALSSLVSQMNPHFIFNCLNSIRLFAAKNDSLSATNYLTKFSRLMRLVLENSKSERITLQKEIETLQLYIDMEAMRFKNKLNYDVHFETGMDTEYIELPPMIVQPYVENAIWHGLMHKEEGGKLDIAFAEKDDILIITVRDNGIGRVKAAQIENKTKSHKSLGMEITNERLELINQKYRIKASVAINDLYEHGNAAGTEIIIKIPIL